MLLSQVETGSLQNKEKCAKKAKCNNLLHTNAMKTVEWTIMLTAMEILMLLVVMRINSRRSSVRTGVSLANAIMARNASLHMENMS